MSSRRHQDRSRSPRREREDRRRSRSRDRERRDRREAYSRNPDSTRGGGNGGTSERARRSSDHSSHYLASRSGKDEVGSNLPETDPGVVSYLSMGYTLAQAKQYAAMYYSHYASGSSGSVQSRDSSTSSYLPFGARGGSRGGYRAGNVVSSMMQQHHTGPGGQTMQQASTPGAVIRIGAHLMSSRAPEDGSQTKTVLVYERHGNFNICPRPDAVIIFEVATRNMSRFSSHVGVTGVAAYHMITTLQGPGAPQIIPSARQMYKVSAHSNVKSVAGSIAHTCRRGPVPVLLASGDAALNQAIKGIAIARTYLAEDSEFDFDVQPEFRREIIGERQAGTYLVLSKYLRSKPKARFVEGIVLNEEDTDRYEPTDSYHKDGKDRGSKASAETQKNEDMKEEESTSHPVLSSDSDIDEMGDDEIDDAGMDKTGFVGDEQANVDAATSGKEGSGDGAGFKRSKQQKITDDDGSDGHKFLRVAQTSDPFVVAGAIAKKIRRGGNVELLAIGGISVAQTVRAIAASRKYLMENNVSVSFHPEFVHLTLDGQQRSGMKFVVYPRLVVTKHAKQQTSKEFVPDVLDDDVSEKEAGSSSYNGQPSRREESNDPTGNDHDDDDGDDRFRRRIRDDDEEDEEEEDDEQVEEEE